MQVLIVVVDDNGRSETFQLERVGVTPNYVKFKAGDMGTPLIYKVWVAKSFKANPPTLSKGS